MKKILTNVAYPALFKDTRGYTVCVLDAIRLKGAEAGELVDLVKRKKK